MQLRCSLLRVLLVLLVASHGALHGQARGNDPPTRARWRSERSVVPEITCSSDTYGTELMKWTRTNRDWLTEVRTLVVRNCFVSRAFWQELRVCNRLRNLTFTATRFEGNTIPTGAFGKVTLRHLIVMDTDLMTIQPDAFDQHQSIEDIVLVGNELLKLQNDMFRPLRRVGLIEIAGSNLQKIPAGAFDGMDIGELCLENNKLDEFPVEAAGKIRSVGGLNLRGNPIQRVPSNSLRLLSINELILSDCGIVEVAEDAFVGVPNLRTIDLSNNLLYELARATFKRNPALVNVQLHDNMLSTLDDNLLKWEALGKLGLANNQWTCTCGLGKTISKVRVPANLTCQSPVHLRDEDLQRLHPRECLISTTARWAVRKFANDVDVSWLQQQTVRRRRLTTVRKPRAWQRPASSTAKPNGDSSKSTTITSSSIKPTEDYDDSSYFLNLDSVTQPPMFWREAVPDGAGKLVGFDFDAPKPVLSALSKPSDSTFSMFLIVVAVIITSFLIIVILVLAALNFRGTILKNYRRVNFADL